METKLILNYTKQGEAVSDYEAQDFVEKMIRIVKEGDHPYYYFEVSTGNVISELQLAILEDKIDFKNVEVQFEGKGIPFNEIGMLIEHEYATRSMNVVTRTYKLRREKAGKTV